MGKHHGAPSTGKLPSRARVPTNPVTWFLLGVALSKGLCAARVCRRSRLCDRLVCRDHETPPHICAFQVLLHLASRSDQSAVSSWTPQLSPSRSSRRSAKSRTKITISQAVLRRAAAASIRRVGLAFLNARVYPVLGDPSQFWVWSGSSDSQIVFRLHSCRFVFNLCRSVPIE